MDEKEVVLTDEMKEELENNKGKDPEEKQACIQV